MRKPLFTTLLCLGFFTGAFSQKREEIIAQLRSQVDKEFTVVSIPDSLKNESAVIIAYQEDNIADIVNGGIKGEVSISHYRIKLLDQAAVKEFSEISFPNNTLYGRNANEYSLTSIHVIKANGKEIDIDVEKNAVKNEDIEERESKIAVPNLEPNDIIDYFSASKTSNFYGIVYDIKVFPSKYPTLHTKLRIQTPKKIRLRWYAQNGAPGFTETTETNGIKTYILQAGYTPKQKNLLWVYPLRTSPTISYASVESSLADTTYLFDKNNLIIQTNLLKYFTGATKMPILEDYFKAHSKEIDKKDQKALVNEFFYLIRNPLYQDVFFERTIDPTKTAFPEMMILPFWNNFLENHSIDFEYIYVPSRLNGTLKSAPFIYYLTPYLKIKPNNGAPVYVGMLSPFQLPNDIGTALEGCNGFAYHPKKDKTIRETTREDIIPESTKNDNTTTTNYTLSLNSDNQTQLNVKRYVSTTGHCKISHQTLVVTPYDYLVQYDIEKYHVSKSHLFSGMLEKYNAQKANFEQRKAQDYSERDKNVKEKIESSNDVRVASYKSLHLTHPGMWEDHPACEYSDEFVLDNVSKQAGPNIILELPKLIEKQEELSENDKQRKEDAYLNYAKTSKYHFTFTIPEGYTAEGIDALNKKVESETGGFISTAKVEGNILTIDTYKYYNTNYVPANQFSTMFGFLQAAVDFSKHKILLRKN